MLGSIAGAIEQGAGYVNVVIQPQRGGHVIAKTGGNAQLLHRSKANAGGHVSRKDGINGHLGRGGLCIAGIDRVAKQQPSAAVGDAPKEKAVLQLGFGRPPSVIAAHA